MARSVDNVDFRVFIDDSGVFGKDGDAPFPFDVIGIHNAFRYFLIGAENAALL